MSSSPEVSKQATTYSTASNATDNVFGSSEGANRLWHHHFQDLRMHQVNHGNFSVPPSYGGTQLPVWVHGQHSNYQLMNEGKPSSMTDDCIRQLNPNGYQWSTNGSSSRVTQGKKTHKEKWNERFHELKAYKAKHGHCNVPIRSGALGTWVGTQRRHYRLFKEGKSSSMTDERARQLESIGFQWSLVGCVIQRDKTSDEKMWNARFHELEAYKGNNGHCNVPRSSGKLGSWVKTQRHEYRLLKQGKTSSMTDERVQKLESIGFSWSSNYRSRFSPTMKTCVAKNDAAVGKSGKT